MVKILSAVTMGNQLHTDSRVKSRVIIHNNPNGAGCSQTTDPFGFLLPHWSEPTWYSGNWSFVSL